jgi:ribosomal protein S18 acetylase RimI-like enzyme
MNNIEFKIQNASIEIAPALFELEKKVFTRPFDLPSRSIDEFNSFLSKSTFIFAKDSEHIVGFLAFDREEDQSIELKLIVVDQNVQGKGYGKQLLQTLEKIHKETRIHLTVHPDNAQGIGFYLKNGFQIKKRIENCYGDGQPRLVLEKFSSYTQ